MRVWVLSNQHQACGIAEYGRDLSNQLRQWYDVTLSTGPKVPAEVIVVNWHNGRINVAPTDMMKWQADGAKVIVILHNSWEAIELGPPELDILAVADCIVAHEPMQFRPEPKKFRYIKHGLTAVKDLPEVNGDSIGTAGFPFEWKRFDLVACAARDLGVTCRIAAPRHDSEETDRYVNGIIGHLGHLADVRRHWMSKEDVAKMLATCTLNIFWYESQDIRDQLGQSGSVLMGVAAGRPMIISPHRKFRVLREEYADEFYIAQTVDEVYRIARDIFCLPEERLRKPRRCREEMAWEQVGWHFHNLIEEMVPEYRDFT
jgi:hypothetical protein